MTTFILADHQELTSYALECLIRRLPEQETLHAEDKAELLLLLQKHPDAIVIIDYTLFDFFGVEDLLNIDLRYPQLRWVIISEDLTEDFLRQVVCQSHHISVLFKDATLREINEAISSARRGNRHLCQRVTELLISRTIVETPDKCVALTPTEIEIMRAIAQGKTTREIATERFLSLHTVTTHRKNIYRKLCVNTVHEAIKAAVRCGYISEADYFI